MLRQSETLETRRMTTVISLPNGVDDKTVIHEEESGIAAHIDETPQGLKVFVPSKISDREWCFLNDHAEETWDSPGASYLATPPIPLSDHAVDSETRLTAVHTPEKYVNNCRHAYVRDRFGSDPRNQVPDCPCSSTVHCRGDCCSPYIKTGVVARKCTCAAVHTDAASGFDADRLSSHAGERKNNKIGFAGELLQHTRTELPKFTVDNWRSSIRHCAQVHSEHESPELWNGPGTVGIVYDDTSAAFITELLAEKGHLSEFNVDRLRHA
ncbi:hypothetical protein GMORB2_0291 [Geosmithia morbida]|uniref:Uncharacterized protein n=1 Tax=Geosmithia morbida TaxID=1094350 RepID=A0A9P4Z0Y3_9HYPO|nr:uncharacterized protein GMORB2_0291 [Geosmithia morbida]KAF4126555.1 hypothetical protein GMORB2_0291 [Geosmithia morbida]